MPNEQLISYIRGEFAHGADRAAIIRALLASGWKVEDINAAMASIDGAPANHAPAAPQAPVAPAQPSYAYSIPAASGQALSVKTLVQNTAAGIFIACVVVLTAVSILGVWNVFSGDVITKSFETLGLLAFVSIVVVLASRHIGDPAASAVPSQPQPAFRAIRNMTLAALIGSASLLALLGVLAIWNVINDSSTVDKSLSSLAIIAFSSLIIVMVCLEREQTPPKKKAG